MVDKGTKAWRELLADIIAGGRPFHCQQYGTRQNTKMTKDHCGEGYDHKAGQRLTGRGRSWLAGQYSSGSTLGGSPAEWSGRYLK